MSLLDTVEPDAFLTNAENATKVISAGVHQSYPEYRNDYDVPAYSRPKVEALLAECRKQAKREAFLEAADEAYSMSHFDCADELRRMAEGDK